MNDPVKDMQHKGQDQHLLRAYRVCKRTILYTYKKVSSGLNLLLFVDKLMGPPGFEPGTDRL